MAVEVNFSDGRKVRQESSGYVVEDSWGQRRAVFQCPNEAFSYAARLRSPIGILPIALTGIVLAYFFFALVFGG